MNSSLIPYAKYDSKRKRRWTWVVGAVVVLLILTAIITSRSKSSSSSSSNPHHGSDIPASMLNHKEIGRVGPPGIDEQISMIEDTILLEASKQVPQSEAPSIFDNQGREIGLRFLIVSDCGGTGTPPYTTATQMKLARTMNDKSKEKDVSFILSLGDNFSPAGIRDLDDIRFQDTFEDPFDFRGLQKPWYIVAGNDDYKGNITAELAYSHVSKRWNFYRLNYMLSGNLPTHPDTKVDIVMIDTVQLCGRLPPTGLVTPMGPDNKEEAETTWTWIESKLKASNADFLFVAGHYPVYSGGKHGSTKCLIERLQPLLERYRVSAYFSGHDHSLQHIKSPGEGGVHYIVTGATSPDEDRLQHLDGVQRDTRFFWTNHLDKTVGGFLYCDVRKEAMTVEFLNSKKILLHTATVRPRSWSDPVKVDADQKRDNKVVDLPVMQRHPRPPHEHRN